MFYCARVLRRARKVAASTGRPESPVAYVRSDEVAALAARCDYLEWYVALAQQNAVQLHQRLCELEAAVPQLTATTVSPEAQIVVPELSTTAAPDLAAPSEAATPADVVQQQPAAHREGPAVAQLGALGGDASDPSTEEGACSPAARITEQRVATEPLRSRWAVLQGLQKAPELNGRLVRVGSQRQNGRYATVRPGSGDRLAVRAENLRGLLEKYASHESGNEVAFHTATFCSWGTILSKRSGHVRKGTCIAGCLCGISNIAAVCLCSN